MFTDGQDFYSVFFNNLEEGICIVDKQGTILMNNSAMEDIFGYGRNELLQQNIDRLLPDTYKSAHRKYLQQYFISPYVKSRGGISVFQGLTKNGNLIDIEIGMNHFNYQGIDYAKATITDISFRKGEEIKIREQNYRLQLEVKKHTAELRETVSQIKKANKKLNQEIKKKIAAENKANKALHKELELNQLQTKFLSVVSHEFKTPLSGMLTSATLIDKYTAELDSPNIKNHIQTIKKLIFQLNTVLNDFLNLEKSDAKNVKYELTFFNICELLDQVIQNSGTIMKPGQHFVIEKPEADIEIFNDQAIMTLILRNLIYNAIKYSHENKVIKVSIKLKRDLFISIQDKGIGIPEADQAHIFNRFFRAKNALHFQGTGIGLNLVKYHAERLGGQIYFRSKEDKGSTFTLRLPVIANPNNNNRE
jgi:PAS domain S-box-containing protein